MATAKQNSLPIMSVKHHPKCQCKTLKSFKCEELFSYSCDGDNMFLPDDSEIRYLCMPEDPDDVLFDLKDNYETYIERDRSAEMIDRVLRSLQHAERKDPPRKQADDDDDLVAQMSGLKLDTYNPEIICRRGLLRDVMTTPYLLQSKNKDGWSVTAIKHDKKIFLGRSSKPEETWGTEEEIRLSSYTGSKFEQYVSKRTEEGPPIAERNEVVDTRKGFYTLTKAQLGKHTLIYGGEVDCCDLEDKGPNRRYVQFKTTKMLSEPPKYFQSLKLMKWWAQSHLVGIKKIVCGIKDHDAIVFQVKTYNVDQLCATCNNQWSPCVCFDFLDNFINFVKKVLTDAPENPRIPYVFTWTPGERQVNYRKMALNSENCFLPDWFIKGEEGIY